MQACVICNAQCTTVKKIFDFVVLLALHSIMSKPRVLQIRLAENEKASFDLAAEIAGLQLSSWVRERLRLACIRDLESAGRRVPFVDEIPLTQPKHEK